MRLFLFFVPNLKQPQIDYKSINSVWWNLIENYENIGERKRERERLAAIVNYENT